MRRVTRNYILALIMLPAALFQAVSGFIIWRARHEGDGFRGGGIEELGEEATSLWEKHTLSDVHAWVAVALLVLLIIHIVLNWKWIVYTTKNYFIKR